MKHDRTAFVLNKEGLVASFEHNLELIHCSVNSDQTMYDIIERSCYTVRAS